MNKVLRKRILRDLKSNFARYFALLFLIVMGMYIVVSMVGSAESIISGTEQKAIENHTEDGEFTVFIPLTERQVQSISEEGVTLEKMFSMDITLSDDSMLRLMKNRESINLIDLDDGALAKNFGEVVLEKRYAQVHNISVGDKISFADTEFSVTGIGSVPDYDKPVAKFSDVSVKSESFGLAFVTSEQYEQIKNSVSLKAEDYTYAYLLGATMSDASLKKTIQDFPFDYHDIDDPYFKEMLSDIFNVKENVQGNLDDLYEGAEELTDGIDELTSNHEKLADAANEIWDGALSGAEDSLEKYGFHGTLTEENYATVLDDYIQSNEVTSLKSLKETLNSIKACRDEILTYLADVECTAEQNSVILEKTDKFYQKANNMLDDFFELDINNLTSFIAKADNTRIAEAENDVLTDKSTGLFAGVIILILFSYVISVFVIHQIQKESSVIGALYALGVKKNQLLRHYTTLPTVIAFLGGLIGLGIAFSPLGVPVQMQSSYDYFSIPKFEILHPAYLIVYGAVLPAVVSMIVNTIVIHKKLSMPALALIKNEQKTKQAKAIPVKTNHFIRMFQTRQMIRETRTALTVVLGMFIAMLVFTLGMNIWIMCSNVEKDMQADASFHYMYTYKYPDGKVPSEGESAYSETLSKTAYGYTLDVNVMGITQNSAYFKAVPQKEEDTVVVSSSVSQRYGVKEGDLLTLTDKTNEKEYTFKVTGVADYSVSLTVFMDIDNMRELFHQNETYYNVVLSSQKLDIPEGKLYSVITKEEIIASSSVYLTMMYPTIYMLTAVSVVIFCVVMYLMMGVMIDRSSFGISLLQIFGFRTKEIKQLYLNGNTVLIAVGGLCSMFLAKAIIDTIYPSMVANLSSGINLTTPTFYYPAVFAGIMLIYFIINHLLVGKIKKITPAEVLKNRD